MSALEQIRKRTGLMLIVVGVAMIFFIVDPSTLGSDDRKEPIAGKVHGNKITTQEYEKEVLKLESLYKGTPQSNQPGFSDQVRNSAWNTIVNDKIYEKELKSLGLKITENEEYDILFGDYILPDVKSSFGQQFLDENGQFDKTNFATQMNLIENKEWQNPDNNPEVDKNYNNFRNQWLAQKEVIKQNYLKGKYTTLLEKGVYVTTNEAKHSFEAKNSSVDFEFVYIPFNETIDSTIKISDSDLEDYYEAHKNDKKYEQVAMRQFDYTTFSLAPSEDDDYQAKKWLEDMKEDFINSENDTVFVRNNTSNRTSPIFVDYEKGDILGLDTVENEILNSKVGDVFGPVKDQNSYKLLKTMNNGPWHEMNASQILVQADTSNEEQVAKAIAFLDSIRSNITDSTSFALAALTNGIDDTKDKGGELGWFDEKGLALTELTKAVFKGKTGDMPIVKTRLGVHLVRINGDRTEDKLKLAVIEKEIEVSENTMQTMYDKANSFAMKARNEGFKETAQEVGLSVLQSNQLYPDRPFISGINNPNEFLRWAFNADLNNVSEPKEDDNKFVVAHLTKSSDYGVPSFEAIKDLLKVELIKEKKADLYKEKLVGADLNAIAQNAGKTVLSASSSFNQTYLSAATSDEPYIIGYAFSLSPSTLSTPLVGNSGVFVINVKGVNAAAETDNYSSEKQTLNISAKSNISGKADRALRDKAEIRDLRLIN